MGKMNDFISVITPTYNREKTLNRVYNSLLGQTYKNYEWIIIDDGSTDKTYELVEKWIEAKQIRIRYFFQKNSGKHVAVNNAINEAKGEWIIIADSDDAFREDSLEFLLGEYYKIPEKKRDLFSGVSCRCYSEDKNNILGDSFPDDNYIFDCKECDFKYKYRIDGELWGMIKKSIMLQNPFPEIKNAKFYPESIIWDSISDDYITRYINEPLRYYYRDASNSVTITRKYNRSIENYYLWLHHINHNFKYFRYNPKLIVKSLIGITMDSKLSRIPWSETIKKINSLLKKICVILLSPLGFILYLFKK